MPEELDRQSFIDEEHLKLVSLGFMISAGLGAIFASFGLLYMLMGIGMSVALSHVPVSAKNPVPPPAFIGWIFGAMGLVLPAVGDRSRRS